MQADVFMEAQAENRIPEADRDIWRYRAKSSEQKTRLDVTRGPRAYDEPESCAHPRLAPRGHSSPSCNSCDQVLAALNSSPVPDSMIQVACKTHTQAHTHQGLKLVPNSLSGASACPSRTQHDPARGTARRDSRRRGVCRSGAHDPCFPQNTRLHARGACNIPSLSGRRSANSNFVQTGWDPASYLSCEREVLP